MDRVTASWINASVSEGIFNRICRRHSRTHAAPLPAMDPAAALVEMVSIAAAAANSRCWR